MSVLGSPQWFDDYAEAFATCSLDGADWGVSYVIEKSPVGKLAWTERWVDGSMQSVEAGAAKDATVAFTLKWSDFEMFMAAASSPAVLFMQGRLKMSGDMAVLFEIVASLGGDDFVVARAGLLAALET
jgi:hypothetical protein